MPTKAKRLTSIALIFILVIPLFTAFIPMPGALGLVQNPDEAINFKEVRAYGATAPFNGYQNSTGGAPANTFRQTTALHTTASGFSLVFFVFRASLLDGATLNIRHSLAIGGTIAYYIRIYDGSYDRTSILDFPEVAPWTLKGNGYIQNINTTTVAFAEKTETYSLSFSAALTWVTLFFWINDGGGNNLATATYYNISIVRGGSTVFFTDFDGDVICDLAEENMVQCRDNAWPDTNLDSSGYVDAAIVDIDPCIPVDFEILNPSALAEDGTPWVYTGTKFYWFNASYINFDLEGGDEASIRFSPDGSNNVTVTYAWLNNINGLLSVSDSEDFITVPSVARNGTGASYNSTSMEIWINFPVWFTDNSPDAQNVDVYYACTGIDYLDSGEDFHIYNQGGLVEREPPTDNATWTEGGEWFEGCVFANGSLTATQTFRKIQQVRYEYALRFYENVSGTWVPEDQFMQTFQHSGGGAEKYGGIFEWILRWRILAFDNTTDTWAELIQVSMWMSDGDEGATDEWITISTEIVGNSTALGAKNWNAFIEEEPAARFRTWVDIWINKINASSVIATRTNAYYFGMENGAWLLWQPWLIGGAAWSPMIYNSTEAIAFVPLAINNTDVVQARVFDLMKIEMEMDIVRDAVPASSDPYRVCIEDVNVNEVLLSSRGEVLEGINTPIFIAPKVANMPIGGLLGGLWQAITALGDTLWSALTGIADIAWAALADQFPWFTGAWESFMGLLESITTLATTIIGYLIAFFTFTIDYITFLATPINMIRDTWITVSEGVAVFWSADPSAWLTLFIIVFGVVPIMMNLEVGNYGYVEKVLGAVWGVADTVLEFFIRILRFIVMVLSWVWPF